jgi:hypothetical protein
MAAESQIRWARQDEDHTAHTGNGSGEARAAVARTRADAASSGGLQRADHAGPAGQDDLGLA